MSGLRLAIPVTFTDNTLPVLRDDLILSTGSLALVDFAHSANPLVGVPITGTGNIPNHAWKEAAAALGGTSTQADWALDAFVNLTAADGFVERSGKGGLHVCMSQATHVGTNKGAAVRKQVLGASPLLQFLYNNPTHKYYFSRWERITRVGLTTTPELVEAAIYSVSGGSNVNGLVQLTRTGGVNRSLGITDSPATPQTVGPTFRSAGMDGWSAAGRPTGASDIVAALMAIGQQPSLFNAATVNKSRSAVLYRAYLEDLTVSGRTYAEVQALDKGLFDQAFAAGGRFFGDTFTDPATLP